MASDQASAVALEDNQLLPIRDDQNIRATQSSSAGSANLPEFPIEDVFRNWIKDEHAQGRLSRIYRTHASWEAWARVEIGYALSISNNQPVDEAEIYQNAEDFADLILRPDKNHKGLIIELICENELANKGSSINDSIQDKIAKKRELKEEYKEYTFKVIALTYSKAAETAVRALGLAVMPGIEVDQACASGKSKEETSDEQPVTLRVFQKNIH